MKALIIGATGATGKDLLDILLKDEDYAEIVIFVRRPGGITHPKLIEIVTNFDQLEDISGHIQGDVLFSCIGTTRKEAGSRKKQWHIHLEIPLEYTAIAKRNGIPKIVLLSAYGASATSNVFYSRMKGELEEGIAGLAFEQHTIFRPGLLLRDGSDRAGERISEGLLCLFNSLGLFWKFQPLPTAVLAEKLAKAPKVLTGGQHLIELDKIFEF